MKSKNVGCFIPKATYYFINFIRAANDKPNIMSPELSSR